MLSRQHGADGNRYDHAAEHAEAHLLQRPSGFPELRKAYFDDLRPDAQSKNDPIAPRHTTMDHRDPSHHPKGAHDVAERIRHACNE